MPTQQQSKRTGKRPSNKPARARYWSSHRLRDRKVKNIVRSSGMDPVDARILWDKERKGRVKR